MVTDTGGIDDRSFNASAWAGMQAAKTQAPNVDPKYVASTAEADYEPNLRGFVTKKCNFILAVGGLMGTATAKVAAEAPSSQFGIVDSSVEGATNVYPMQFATHEAAFLAGYLAAGSTQSGTVATYGGMDIPTVTVFMDGFADGVAHYNEVKGENVRLLGWDKDAQDGTFVNSFTDTSAAKTTTQNFINEGADIVLPVAGQAALGTLDAVVEANDGGREVRFVWVDADGYETLDQGKQYQLTSVLKQMSTSVQDVVETAAGGQFDNTPYVGTLENEGVGIAPFHDQQEAVGEELAAEVEQLRQDIIAGTITVESQNSPQA
ncbi:MAG TPA: BMP family ABC transporter substrate-binding protein [Kocuria rosea]|nr:BMP family ABC transporter substrate-binding protein [Kocuria rosea]